MKGFVYILTNEYMPGIVKIGRTSRSTKNRAHELFMTGVPAPFEVSAEVLSPDCATLEEKVHSVLCDVRISQAREFFKIDLTDAAQILHELHKQQVDLWLDRFLPDHQSVQVDEIVDGDVVFRLGEYFSLHKVEVISALSMIDPRDLMAAVERYRQWRDERRVELGLDDPTKTGERLQ